MDPYIPDKKTIFLRQRKHAYEKPGKTGFELREAHERSKLYKPFESKSHRTLEAEKFLKGQMNTNDAQH